jgi:hypothetical protein
MPTNRYINDSRIRAGQQFGTAAAVVNIRAAIKAGEIPIVRTVIATGSDRLDTLAGNIYGDAKYWWVLAAASGIGWGLQVPPDTVISVPSLSDVDRYL